MSLSVCFVNDTSEDSNWGCRATTACLAGLVTEAGATITNHVSKSRMERSRKTHRLSATDRVFGRLGRWLGRRPAFELKCLLSRGRDLLRTDWLPKSAAALREAAHDDAFVARLMGGTESLARADVVLINGEGSIYDFQDKGRHLLALAWVAKERFGKPVALVNHTAELGHPAMRELAELVYPRLDDVVAREPLTVETLRPLCRVDFAPDAAFRLQPGHPADPAALRAAAQGAPSVSGLEHFNPERPYVCLGGSSIFLRPDRPYADPLPGLRTLIAGIQRQGLAVVLTAPGTEDHRFMNDLAAEFRLPLFGSDTPTQVAVDLLAGAACFISGRWHPSIFALTGGTPIIVFGANTRKTEALLRMMEIKAPSFDATRLEAECPRIMALLADYLAQGADLRHRLQSGAKAFAESARRNVAALARI